MNKPGYHLDPIPNGIFGETSKIHEEWAEFMDAIHQGVKVMAIQELADMIGAIEGWLEKYHPSVTLADLISMKEVTRRAFENGIRQPRGQSHQ